MLRKPDVQILLLCFAAATFLVAGDLVFADQKRVIPEVSKRLRKYDVLKLDPKTAASQIRRTGKLPLKTSDRVFDLQLVPNDLRSDNYRSQVIGSNGVARALPRSPVNTYKGFVTDMNGAEVRLTITDDTIEGAIITSNGRFFIQPARSLSKTAGKDEFIFYNSQDLTHDAETSGVTLADQVAVGHDRASRYVDMTKISSHLNTLNPRKLVRLATDADAEYVAALGGASQANNHILSIMNQVDGIYQFELGITFQIVFQNAWTNATTDPYTSLDNVILLDQFRTHWNANFASVQRDLAHFWSGKDLLTAGSGYLGVVCRHPDFAYAFSGRRPEGIPNPITASTIGLTAHEIGHNFGAIHPDTPAVLPDITASCGGSIMLITFVTSFCPYSRSEIMGYTNTFASCLLDATAAPPAVPTCVDVPLDPGVTVSASLAPTDCRSSIRGVYHFADRYSFDGQAGQRLHISMNVTSPVFESFLFLIGPDGFVTALDAQNGGGGVSSRIPPSGSVTLPVTGKYTIEATSVAIQQTGNYTINVSLDGCVLTVNPTSQHFAANGGSGVINITSTGNNCSSSYQFAVWPNPTPWLKPQSLNGSAALSFTVDPNSSPRGRRGFLIVGAPSGSQMGGLSIPITQSGTAPDCALMPIAFGETVEGALSSTDCRSPLRGPDNNFADRYVFTATTGQEIVVLASPTGFISSSLTLIGPTGRVMLTDVQGGSIFHTRIPGGNGMLKLGLAGQYVIEITAATAGFVGPYTLTLLNNEPPVLLAEESGDSAIALESVSMLRDPFPLTTPFNLSSDQTTRITLIADNLALLPGENQSAVTAVAQDNLLNSYPLTVEFVGKVPGLGRFTQIVLKLPSNLPVGQEVRVNVTVRGKTSNKVRFRIKN